MPFISFGIPSQHTSALKGHSNARHSNKELQYKGMLSTVTELLLLSSMDGIVRSYSTFSYLAGQSGVIPPLFEAVMGGDIKRMDGVICHRGSPEGVKAIYGSCGK